MLQLVLIIISCSLLLCIGRTAEACSPAPSVGVFVELSEDMQHALVVHAYHKMPPNKYSQSGFYKIGEADEPLWSLKRFIRRMVLTDNGKYMV